MSLWIIIYFLFSCHLFFFLCESHIVSSFQVLFLLRNHSYIMCIWKIPQPVWVRKLQCIKPGELTVSTRLKPEWVTHLGRMPGYPVAQWQTLIYSGLIFAVNWLGPCQDWNIKKVPIKLDNFKHLSLWLHTFAFQIIKPTQIIQARLKRL